MLDIKLIRENCEEVIRRLNTRGKDFSYLREVKAMDEERRKILSSVETLKNERNEKSKQIGLLKRQKLDATEVLNSVAHIGDEIKASEEKLKELEEKIRYQLLITPNLVHEGVKVGKDENDNRVMRFFKEPTKFDFEPKDHSELGAKLGIFDFDRAAKITGARFVIYKGLGARLENKVEVNQ